MVFLLAYAVAIWAVAVVYRRRWQAYAAILLGLPPVALITHWAVLYTHSTQTGPQNWLYAIGAAYAGLIAGVGLLIAVQPRRAPAMEPCRVCGYEVRGIEGVCPECGHDPAQPAGLLRRRPTPRRAGPPDMESGRLARLRLRAGLRRRRRERLAEDARDRGVTPRAASASLDPSG